jgi:hypothetical protein
MPRLHFKRPSPAMVVALIALFVALGGSGYAAFTVNGTDIRNRSIDGRKLKLNTLTSKEIRVSTLGLQRRVMWAMINSSGDAILAQSGDISLASHPTAGRYFLKFPEKVRGRAVLVSPVTRAAGSPTGSADAKGVACGATAADDARAFTCDAPGTNTVYHGFVATFLDGKPTNVPFFVAVLR